MPLFALSEAANTGRLNAPLADVLSGIAGGWEDIIAPWQRSAEGRALVSFVDGRVSAGAAVYPADVLRALRLTPLQSVQVVIVGQDPYHGPGQAQGLAFSVPQGMKTPPSLRNILAELQRDIGMVHVDNDLTGWARQGVLLLNTALTVEDGQPGSHAHQGWEALTQALVAAVALRARPCVYLLWGAHAQQFEPLILASAALAGVTPCVLKANHPSPLSARRPPVPFVGCGHFGAANRYLAQHALGVDWAQ